MLLLLFKPPIKWSDLENECCGKADIPVDCGAIAEFNRLLLCRPFTDRTEEETCDDAEIDD